MLGGISTKEFLRDYWQKKPLLVRQAFPRFEDPVTPEELAGLACEDGIESRLVRGKGKRWDVSWGPHEESAFAKLPEREWTLLVQEVNRWVPEAALMLDHFAFLPNVRVDDVMVSYAEPGGSVGPHLDSYDVFLIQGLGQRRWHWNTAPANDRTFLPELALRILAKPKMDRDEVLEAGDMLYLPPGFAHHGVAETACLTYSIGFRAPAAGEAWASFAVFASKQPGGMRLLEDPAFTPALEPGAIPPALLAKAREFVRSIPHDDRLIDRWFAAHTTRLKPGHTLEAPKRIPNSAAKLKSGAVVARTEEGRWAFLPNGKALFLYIAGEEIQVPAPAVELAKLLCRKRRHDAISILMATKSPAAKALFEQLIAIGALAFLPSRASAR